MVVLGTLAFVIICGMVVWMGILVDENNRMKAVIKKAAQLADLPDDIVLTIPQALQVHHDLVQILKFPHSDETSLIVNRT